MASFIIKVLSVTLGLFFIFVGLLKLSPVINKELYKEMRKQYIRMAKVFPLAQYTGWRPNPHMYRKIVASSEITCGIILSLIPVQPLKIGANILMILLMSNDVLAHFQVKDGIERMGLPIVFILLLSCRLLITVQERAREADKAREAEKAKEADNAKKKKETEDQSKEIGSEDQSKEIGSEDQSKESISTQEGDIKTAGEKKTQ